MTELLIRLFVRDPHASDARGRYGMLSSAVGIVCNVFLCVCKFLIGAFSGSVSVMADSVNNLSDAGSSVVTLIGFRVSGKPADEDHPFGHARAEYIGGLVVSFMILLLGVSFFRTSLERALHPVLPEWGLAAFLTLVVSIAVKLWLCSFNRFIGRAIDSAALQATAQDSLNDVVATSAVLLAACISHWTGLALDGWMGLAVAIFIVVSGVGIARDTVSPLLGQKPPDELVAQIEVKVGAYPGILGMHDLMVHSYGPDRQFASLHAEVDAGTDFLKSHDLIDNIERDVLEELGVHLVIHMDPLVTDDPQLDELRLVVKECIHSVSPHLGMHDFRLVRGETHSNLIFDVSAPFDCPLSDAELRQAITRRIQKHDERLRPVITIDRSYASSGE